MASLRSQHAARLLLLRTSSPSIPRRPTLLASIPREQQQQQQQQKRLKSDEGSYSSTSLIQNLGPRTPQTEPVPPEVKDRNAPDYGVPIDIATSTWTPVPKRVIDGSEDTDILPAAVVSGAPMELQARTVRIYQPAKPATQSGNWGSHHWRMDWDVLGKGHRWENPLMGWQSSGDYMQGTKLEFKSKEDAIKFAEKQGYEYFVQEPNTRAFTPKAYANNFMYSPKKLKHVRTK